MITSLGKTSQSSKSLLLSQSAMTLIKVHLCRSYELMTILPHQASDIFDKVILKSIEQYMTEAITVLRHILADFNRT